jgi:hypothetical protein
VPSAPCLELQERGLKPNAVRLGRVEAAYAAILCGGPAGRDGATSAPETEALPISESLI